MHKLIFGAVAGLCFASGSALALDDDKQILCATTQVQDCAAGGECAGVLPEDVNAPIFMRLRLKKNEIGIGKDRSVKIERSEQVENRLILQGAEDGNENRPDGVGWTMSVNTETGRFVVAIAAAESAIVMFGACTEI